MWIGKFFKPSLIGLEIMAWVFSGVHSLSPVAGFVQRPSSAAGRELYDAGILKNTRAPFRSAEVTGSAFLFPRASGCQRGHRNHPGAYPLRIGMTLGPGLLRKALPVVLSREAERPRSADGRELYDSRILKNSRAPSRSAGVTGSALFSSTSASGYQEAIEGIQKVVLFVSLRIKTGLGRIESPCEASRVGLSIRDSG